MTVFYVFPGRRLEHPLISPRFATPRSGSEHGGCPAPPADAPARSAPPRPSGRRPRPERAAHAARADPGAATIPTGHRPPRLVGPPWHSRPHHSRFGSKKKSQNRMCVWKKSPPGGELRACAYRRPPSDHRAFGGALCQENCRDPSSGAPRTRAVVRHRWTHRALCWGRRDRPAATAHLTTVRLVLLRSQGVRSCEWGE